MDNIQGYKIYSTDEVIELVRSLNTLMDDYTPWQLTKARKGHIDIFGAKIKEGEDYFKKKTGLSVVDVAKLSFRNMELILYALFFNTLKIKNITDILLKDEFEKMRNAIEEIERLRNKNLQ